MLGRTTRQSAACESKSTALGLGTTRRDAGPQLVGHNLEVRALDALPVGLRSRALVDLAPVGAFPRPVPDDHATVDFA